MTEPIIGTNAKISFGAPAGSLRFDKAEEISVLADYDPATGAISPPGSCYVEYTFTLLPNTPKRVRRPRGQKGINKAMLRRYEDLQEWLEFKGYILVRNRAKFQWMTTLTKATTRGKARYLHVDENDLRMVFRP